MRTTAADAHLVRQAIDGDTSSFAALFDRHVGAVHSYALRRLHDESLADEVVSATFLQAWRTRERLLTVQDSVLPWLYGIARNQLHRHWRSERRQRAAYTRVGAMAANQTIDHAESVTQKQAASDRLNRVLVALDLLDEESHAVLTLAVWEGLSYQELADTLALPIGTVRSKLSRARIKLEQAAGGRYE